MKLKFFILGTVFVFCISNLLALTPLTAQIPPYLKTENKLIRNTKIKKGKTLNQIEGDAITLQCGFKGIPQICFTKTNVHFSGLGVYLGDTLLSGTQRDTSENGIKYTLENGDILSMTIQEDGRILIQYEAKSDQCGHFIIPLNGNEFSNSNWDFDKQNIHISPRVKRDGENKILFDGKVKHVKLSENAIERVFGFEFSDDLKVCLKDNTQSKWGLKLMISPAAGQKVIRFYLDPGSSFGTISQAPADRITQVAACNLWQLDRYSLPDRTDHNLLPNGSFEQGFRYWTFQQRSKLNWDILENRPVYISTQEAKFGKHSLAIFAKDRNRWRQPLNSFSFILAPGTYTLSFYAKSDNPGKLELIASIANPLKMWNSNQWQNLKIKPTEEWQRYSIQCKIDHISACPIIFSTNTDKINEDGTCYIDGVQFEVGEQASPYANPLVDCSLITSDPSNFVEYGKKVNASLKIFAAQNISAQVQVKVRDFFDNIRFSKKINFSTDKDGNAMIHLGLNDLPRGVFIVESDFNINGKKHYEIQRFSIMSFLKNIHQNKGMFVDTYVDPLFPMQNFIDVLDRYRKLGYGGRSGYVINDAKLVKLYNDYGIENYTGYIGRTVKNKGTVDYYICNHIEYYLYGRSLEQDTLIKNLTRKGPHSQEFLQKVEEAAATVVRNNPQINSWSFSGEVDGAYPEWANPEIATPERFKDFCDVEYAIARGVKKGNPDACYYVSAVPNVSRTSRVLYYDKLLANAEKNGVKYDGVNMHIYRVPGPEYKVPLTMEEEFERLFKVFDKNGYSKVPVNIPEGMHWMPIRCDNSPFVSSYPIDTAHLHAFLPYSYDLTFSEKMATALRARTWLLGLKFQDRIKSMNASNYGISFMDGLLTIFAYLKVPNTLGRILGNAHFVKELKLFPNTKCYVFEDQQKRPVIAMWAYSEQLDKGEIEGPEYLFKASIDLELYDIMEEQHEIKIDKKDDFKLYLSAYPVFLRGKPNTTDPLISALKAGMGMSSVPILPPLKMRLDNRNELNIELFNPETDLLKGTLSLRSINKNVNIPVGESQSYNFKLPQELTSQMLQRYTMPLMLKISEKSPVMIKRDFSGFLVKKAPHKIVIDGALDDWNNVDKIKLHNRIRYAEMLRANDFGSDQDSSAFYQWTWDEDGLYLALKVVDDHWAWAKRKGPQSGWQNDSIQVMFDTFCDALDKESDIMGPDDWSYGFYPSNDKASKIDVWHHFVPDGQLTLGTQAAKVNTVSQDVKVAWRRHDGYSIVEIRFSPRSLLPFSLKSGNTIGSAIMVNDLDDPSRSLRSSLTNTEGKSAPSERPKSWPLMHLVD
ncbi:MAG: sugar-binding protein [Lentisphaeria bacterium]